MFRSVATRVGTAATSAADQAPVFEALKATLDEEVAGVTEHQEAVTAAIEPLNTAAATLKEAAAPLKVGITSAAGGAPVQFETAQLTALWPHCGTKEP